MKVNAIFGPPGTGKTTTLVKLAERKKSVLFLSFTKAAALEIRSRVASDELTASTIHALAFRHAGANRAQIVDAKKLIQFGNESGIPFKGDDGSDELQEGDEYASVLSFSNNRMIAPMEAYDHFGCPGTRRRFEIYLKSYANWKRTFGYLDFDDLMYNVIANPPILAQKHVFLDEAQDCSPLQWRVFNCMLGKTTNVTIAGDDDQAIYEWNGADPHGMMDFLQANEGEMKILGQSHRVPRVVHDLAHQVALQQIGKRVDKKFAARDEEGTLIRYGDITNVHFGAIDRLGGALVLTRDRWKQEEIKRILNREMIPYDVMGGYSPWTSRIANALRRGEEVNWDSKSLPWREFYRQADLKRPIKITLSTIHQAKGREHDRVVLDLDLPGRTLEAMYNDRDAELRVLYVGLTRARTELVLCGGSPLL